MLDYDVAKLCLTGLQAAQQLSELQWHLMVSASCCGTVVARPAAHPDSVGGRDIKLLGEVGNAHLRLGTDDLAFIRLQRSRDDLQLRGLA